MAMNRNPDKDIAQSDKVLDFQKDLSPGKGNENNSPEDTCKSEHGPILNSEDQSRSHDGFPGLSGSSQKRGPRSGPASDFSAQGLANRKALDIHSNGNERLGSGNRPAESPFRGANAVPLHAEDVRGTVTTPQNPGQKKRPRVQRKSMIPGLNKQASSSLSPPKRQQTPEKPSEPSHAPQHNVSSSAKATSHLFEPHSITPITPTRNKKIQHLKSLSADAPVFCPSPTSSSPATLISPYRKDHERSVSHGSFDYFPSYGSVMPETPYRQSGAQHARQTSMETPFTPIELRNLGHPGAPLQPSLGHHYPGPHQHTPEGQGQYFDNQGSMPPFMPPSMSPFMPSHFSGSFSPNIPPFPYSVDYSNNDAIDQNAQVYKQGEQNAEYSQSNHFDSYASSQAANAAPNAADLHQNGNMYTQDTNGFGPRFYSNHTDPAHQVRLCPVRMGHARLMKTQLNQNLYSPLEPHREPSKPNQRTAKDLFIPEDLRLKLHARTEATLRVFAGRLL